MCISNTNRQLHALAAEVGRPKARALADRVAAINPECAIAARPEWLTCANAADLVRSEMERQSGAPELARFGVVDAIDATPEKAALIDACARLGAHIVTAGAAGGKLDPTAVAVGATSRPELSARNLVASRRDLGAWMR